MHVTPRERSKELREACIEHFKKLHGGHLVCECCGFDFSLAYKDIGEGYIEIHHRFPFSKTEGEHEVDPITDLVPLCSNCHSMIHRVGGQGECMSVEELKEKYFIGKRYN
jgi:5-methylcytosine-specific restriction protein A